MADKCIGQLRQGSRNRGSGDELAELEAGLRRAYVAKELRAQRLEKETERYVESVREQRAAKLIHMERQAAMEEDLRRRSEGLERSERYRVELEEQIARKEEEASVAKDEARREREVLMEVDRLREQREAIKARETKDELSEGARRERLILEGMKAIRRVEEAEAGSRKEVEDRRYLGMVERRGKMAKELREEQARGRERAMREVASILVNVEARRRERAMLVSELLAEDVRREILTKEHQEATRRWRMREELAAGLREQIVLAERCKLRFIEQDRAFAVEVMRRVMEAEETSRLTAEARRRMQSQYREDLNRLVEIRREIREQEMLKVEQAAGEENERFNMELRRVREERKRLLEKHSANVAEFLNKDTLTEEERKIVAQKTVD